VAPARLQDAVSPFDVTAAEFRGNEHERYNSPLNQDRHREHAAQRRAVETAIEHSIRLADDQRRKRERREVAAEERHRVEQGDIDYGDQITGANAETRDIQRFDIDFCAETEMETCKAREKKRQELRKQASQPRDANAPLLSLPGVRR
jgi:hypothetical protein